MMVGKGCDSCREWQEHYYWKHMDVSKISFFKVMTGDFAKGIRIPEKFVRNFKITEEAVDLKVTSGETWHIGLEKHGSELYLMSGWVDFIKAQDLQENDLLIFTCNGHSSFSVLIFEESGCMKVSSLFAPNMCRNFNDMAGQHAEHYSLSDSDDTRMLSQFVGSPHDACVSKKSSGREPHSLNSRSCHVKDEAMEDESDDIYADSKYYYSRVANRLTDDEKEEILSLAPIGLDNPVFVTVLQKAHCRHRNNTLTIPSGFAADNLEARSHDIILHRPNKKEKWTVKYYYTTYHQCFKNIRFFSFVRENKLREGDICVFELMKGVRKVMTVHVIRKKVDSRFFLVG